MAAGHGPPSTRQPAQEGGRPWPRRTRTVPTCPRTRSPPATTTCGRICPRSRGGCFCPTESRPRWRTSRRSLPRSSAVRSSMTTRSTCPSPRASARCTRSIVPARSAARTTWSRPWALPPRSTTSSRATTRAALTSSTPRLPRPTTPTSRVYPPSPPRRARASGEPPSPRPRRDLAWSATSSWCARATSRSRSVAP